MKKNIFFFFVCLFMASCSMFESNKNSNDPSHYPFKESKKDNWGLIDANGKVLIENEFKNEPTNPINGIFFVQDSKENYEMYSIDNPISPIGDKYKDIAAFYDQVTPCVKKNEGIKYIDKAGNIKFDIPLEYQRAYSFLNGYSIIVRKDKETDNYVCDAVSVDGQILKFKEYSIYSILDNNTFLVRDNDENWYLVNHNGDIKTRLKDFMEYYSEPFSYTNIVFSVDKKYYVYYDDEMEASGIRSIEGEAVIKTKEDRVCFFSANGKIVFVIYEDDDETFGTMDLEGNVLIKARYNDLMPMGKDLYVVKKDDKYGLINSKEERLIPYDYAAMLPLSDKNLLAQTKDDSDAAVLLLNKDGKELGEYAKFDKSNYHNKVVSDYFDVAEIFDIMLNPFDDGSSIDNFFGYKGLDPGECVDKMDESYSKSDIDDSNEWLPEKRIEYTDYGYLYYSLGFDEVVISHTEYDYWGYSNTHYSYSNSPCNSIKLKLDLSYSYSDRDDFILKQLPEAMEKCGFSKDDDYYDSYHYKNSKIKLQVSVDYDEIYVIATPNL